MTPNIQLSSLDPVGPINSATDLVLVRQGVSDRKATIDQISNVNFSTYTISGTPLTSTDVLLLGKNIGIGSYQNYAINPQQIGFLAGTRCWFYQNTAPLGWQIVSGTGDRILGVSDNVGNLYNGSSAGSLSGTWLQQDVFGIPGQGLALNQIPLHSHRVKVRSNAGTSTSNALGGGSSGTTYIIGSDTANDPIQLTGDNSGTSGTSAPHNHGQNWRPSSVVGIVCVKTA